MVEISPHFLLPSKEFAGRRSIKCFVESILSLSANWANARWFAESLHHDKRLEAVMRAAAADGEGMVNPSSHSKAFRALSNISNAPTVHTATISRTVVGFLQLTRTWRC